MLKRELDMSLINIIYKIGILENKKSYVLLEKGIKKSVVMMLNSID